MQEYKFTRTVLIPHDTPLSTLLQQHRDIATAIRRRCACHVIPIYPLHCVLNTQLPPEEIKTQITECCIEPPVCKAGLLVRPVTLQGMESAPAAGTVLLKPETLTGSASGAIQISEANIQYPSGLLFGRIDGIQLENSKAVTDIVQEFCEQIPPIRLRVFRLHTAIYTVHMQPDTGKPVISWVLSPPKWVKLPRTGRTPPLSG